MKHMLKKDGLEKQSYKHCQNNFLHTLNNILNKQ